MVKMPQETFLFHEKVCWFGTFLFHEKVFWFVALTLGTNFQLKSHDGGRGGPPAQPTLQISFAALCCPTVLSGLTHIIGG